MVEWKAEYPEQYREYVWDFLIFKDKRGLYVAVDRQFSAYYEEKDDATDVIQNALNDARNGGTVLLAPGTFTTSSLITIPEKKALRGLGLGDYLTSTKLRPVGCDGVKLSKSGFLSNLLIKCDAGYNAITVDYTVGNSAIFNPIVVEHVIVNEGATGILIKASNDYYGRANYFHDVYIRNTDVGIKVEHNSTKTLNLHVFSKMMIRPNTIGIEIQKLNTGDFIWATFRDIHIDCLSTVTHAVKVNCKNCLFEKVVPLDVPSGAYSWYIEGSENVLINCVATQNVYDAGGNKWIECDYYKTKNGGIATFSGDGATKQFTIPHGLAVEPNVVIVTPMSADGSEDFYVTKDANNIYVNYITAPPSGTDNVVLSWYAEA